MTKHETMYKVQKTVLKKTMIKKELSFYIFSNARDKKLRIIQ